MALARFAATALPSCAAFSWKSLLFTQIFEEAPPLFEKSGKRPGSCSRHLAPLREGSRDQGRLELELAAHHLHDRQGVVLALDHQALALRHRVLLREGAAATTPAARLAKK